jgi:hypothetical protein
VKLGVVQGGQRLTSSHDDRGGVAQCAFQSLRHGDEGFHNGHHAESPGGQGAFLRSKRFDHRRCERGGLVGRGVVGGEVHAREIERDNGGQKGEPDSPTKRAAVEAKDANGDTQGSEGAEEEGLPG